MQLPLEILLKYNLINSLDKNSFIFETFGKKIVKMMYNTYMYETIRDIGEKNGDEA